MNRSINVLSNFLLELIKTLVGFILLFALMAIFGGMFFIFVFGALSAKIATLVTLLVFSFFLFSFPFPFLLKKGKWR
jgi:hypothetical protein